MATLGNRGDLRDFFKLLLSQNNSFTDAEINGMLNVAYKKVIATAECLEDIRTISSVAYQGEYALPGSIIKVQDVYFRGQLLDMFNYRGILRDNLGKKQPSAAESQTVTRKCYTKNYGASMYVGLYGTPSDGASATTLAANITSADLSIQLTSISGFENIGSFILNSSEVIHYVYTSGAYAKGCIRSSEDTSAGAANTAGQTIVERDIVCYVVPNPADMDDDADAPLIDESYRELIVKGALVSATLALKMFDVYAMYRKEFYEECYDVRSKFNYKEPGKNQRIRPFIEKYA